MIDGAFLSQQSPMLKELLMVGKDRHNRAIHEAGHAVIARMLGNAVVRVAVKVGSPHALSSSAAQASTDLNAAARIVGYETDAKIALAGLGANRREHPHLRVFDLSDDDPDTVNARSAIYRIVRLKAGEPASEGKAGVVLIDPDTMSRMDIEYWRLIAETAKLVDQYWPAIRRTAKHLERHDEVDQTELDRLIDVGMRSS